ncbi:ATP-binding protein [Microbacterium pumilum]|uniref:HTH luxR-type domain-containing protein n=1 Tax=Microbacterium pumilum TaxID=344165 RepID=A0ABP5DF13_9MICO
MRDWAAPPLPLRWRSADQPPFVGREHETGLLYDAWADAVDGLGKAVFVGGVPGIGKSRLVSEVCVRLHDAGAVIFVGSCIPEFGAPYEPFVEPIRAMLSLARGVMESAGQTASVQILDSLTGRGEGAPSSTASQSRLYDAVVDVLRAAAGVTPLALVLDDLQWADPDAIRLLARVVEAAVSLRVLIIGTARSTQPDVSEALASAIAGLSRLDGVLRIDLVALEEKEIVAYLGRRTSMEAAAAAVPARVLLELTGGNPFLLRETWAHVLAAVANGTSRVDMPETVHDLLRSRIIALDSRGRTVLQYAAVLGQEVDLGELIAVCDTSHDETLKGVDDAVALGLLEPPRLVSECYRFPHAIGRQAVIDQMFATHVTRLHAKVAGVLEAQFPTAPRIVQRLAYHYESARSLGYRQKAADKLGRAATTALERLAFEEAASLYERAADCAAGTGDRDDFRLRAARRWIDTTDFPRAQSLCELVAAEGSTTQRAEAAIMFGDATFRSGLGAARAAELLRAAWESLPIDCEPGLRVRCLASLGRATTHSGGLVEGESVSETAVSEARQLGDAAALGHALYCSLTSTVTPSTLERSRARAIEAMILVGQDDDSFGPCVHFLGTASYMAGDPEGIESAQRMLLQLVRRAGAFWHYQISCMHVARLLGAGRLDDVGDAMQAVRRDEREFKSEMLPGMMALQSYMVRRESSLLDRIAPLVSGEESLENRWVPGLLALYTELGMVDPARRALGWLLDRAARGVWDSAGWHAQLAFLAEAAIWLEDRHAASLIRPWLAEYAGMNLIAGHFIATFGSADRYIGQLDSLCGVGEPETSLAAALEMDRRMGAHMHVALTWLALAAHRRRSGASDADVQEATESARAIAEPAGLRRVMRLLHAQTDVARISGPDGLTAREVEVIRLLADGLSNRDVATRLVISEHTAANHVRSILFKINAVNRTQAAMYARDCGLV